jgi:hypothetical protein
VIRSHDWQRSADSVEKVAPCLACGKISTLASREARSMMEQLSSGQERLFYSFNLEDHIPANHLLRSIDRCLDLSDLRRYLDDFYSPIGHPWIDPELMIRMLIVGYCYGIRSERRLCEEAHLNLAYRWFCRLSLEDEMYPITRRFPKIDMAVFGTVICFAGRSMMCCVAAWTQAWSAFRCQSPSGIHLLRHS